MRVGSEKNGKQEAPFTIDGYGNWQISGSTMAPSIATADAKNEKAFSVTCSDARLNFYAKHPDTNQMGYFAVRIKPSVRATFSAQVFVEDVEGYYKAYPEERPKADPAAAGAKK